MDFSCEIFRWKKEITIGIFFFNIATCQAIGLKTSINCVVDYLNFCSNYEIGSQELRQCFRLHGKQLSDACVQALIADGEVSQEEVNQKKSPPKETIFNKFKTKLKTFLKPKVKTSFSPPQPTEVKYPLLLEWSSNREQIEYNSITPYGIFDKNQ